LFDIINAAIGGIEYHGNTLDDKPPREKISILTPVRPKMKKRKTKILWPNQFVRYKNGRIKYATELKNWPFATVGILNEYLDVK
jgi:hypothetical protein